MKKLRPLAAGLIALLATVPLGHTQSSQPSIQDIISIAREAAAAEPVEDKIIPILSMEPALSGTFWSLQQDTAPLPFLMFPELETIEIAPGIYLFDDRAVDYPAVRRIMRRELALRALEAEYGLGSTEVLMATASDESPTVPGDDWEEGTNEWPVVQFIGPVYGSNDLWLEITNVSFGLDYAGMVLHGTAEDTLYDLQSRENLGIPVAWIDEGFPFFGSTNQDWTPTSVILSNRTVDTLFFRARNLTGDADGDGLANWWEMKYSLDPSNPNSTGPTADGDLNTDGDDYSNIEEFILGYDPTLPDPPRATISVGPPDASAGEPNNVGQFTVSRSGVTTRDLTVYLTWEGLAKNGTDFGMITNQITFGVGQSSIALQVSPIDDSAYEGTEDVLLRLMPGLDYVVAATDSATVNIADNDLPGVKVGGPFDPIVEGSGTNGTLRFLRTGDTHLALTVNFNLSGTATNGVIFQTLPASVTFTIGVSETNLNVVPINNTNYSGITTSLLAVATSASYRIETNAANVSLTFQDDDLPYVTVIATDSDARESGFNPGRFTFTRTGTTQDPLIVFYRVSGSATMGEDYQFLTNLVVFPTGQSTTVLDVTPLQDTKAEPMEKVIVTIAGNEVYRIGASNAATVSIDDDEPLSYLFKVVRPSIYGPSVGRNMPGELQITRTGSALAASSMSWSVTDTNGNTIYVGHYTRSGDFSSSSPFPFYFAPNQSVATVKLGHTATSVTNMQFRFGGQQSPAIPCWGPEHCVMITSDIRDYAVEGDPFTKAQFAVRRAANGPPLTIKLLLSGTATPGTDTTTTNGQVVTFQNNTSQVIVAVNANADGITEGWESLIVRLDTSDLTYTTYNSEIPVSATNQETYKILWLREGSTTTPKPIVDTDGDWISDSYEDAYGLNPLIQDDYQLDGDKDGMSLLEEHDSSTNPSSSDTDGDGVGDFVEMMRGTSPTNVLDFAFTGRTARVNCLVGDNSGSTSERWQLVVGNMMLNNGAPGLLINREISLREGSTNTIRLRHMGSILNPPDYDYRAELQSPDSTPPAFFLRDPQNLLGSHEDPGDGPDFASKTATIIIPKVELTWTNKGDNLVLDMHTNAGNREVRGNRIFVGSKTPSENLPRNTVMLKIKTTPPLVGSNVWLRAFDVDDTTDDMFDSSGVIDTTGRSGEDNFNDYLNTPKTGVFVANSQASYSTTLNSSGEALVEIRVGMQPGNNYRIAATVFPSNNLATLQSATATDAGYVSPYTDIVRTGFNGVLSPLLTVWRRLHLEVDSMEALPASGPEVNFKTGILYAISTNTPKAGQSTVILNIGIPPLGANELENGVLTVSGSSFPIVGNYTRATTFSGSFPRNVIVVQGVVPTTNSVACSFTDDDDRFLTTVGLPAALPKDSESGSIVSNILRVFRPACIEIVDGNAAGLNPNRRITFLRNSSPSAFGPGSYDDAKNLHDSQNFWIHTVTFGYQGDGPDDGDPNTEDPFFGATVKKSIYLEGGITGVFVETIRDATMDTFAASQIGNPAQYPAIRADYWENIFGIVAHEIAHAPGGQSGTADHAEDHLMQVGARSIRGSAFSPITVKRFRTADQWSD